MILILNWSLSFSAKINKESNIGIAKMKECTLFKPYEKTTKKTPAPKSPRQQQKNTHREMHCVTVVHECIIPAEQERVTESLKILYLNESCLISKVFWLNRKD